MRCVLQRVQEASVLVEQKIVGSIDSGWLILLGIESSDSSKEVSYLAEKIVNLRAFNDDQQKMNLSLKDINGSILLISQFTLYGNTKKGRRPSFDQAAKPEIANDLYLEMAGSLEQRGIKVELGIFGADMKISLINDGPVTLILDTDQYNI